MNIGKTFDLKFKAFQWNSETTLSSTSINSLMREKRGHVLPGFSRIIHFYIILPLEMAKISPFPLNLGPCASSELCSDFEALNLHTWVLT